MIEIKQIHIFFLLAALVFARTSSAEPTKGASHVIDVKSPDGTILKGTYFAAAKPGPGVLLLHQVNRDRKSWEV